MKVLLAAFLLAANCGFGQWMELKPAEFEPLTSVPWDAKGATLPTVLDAIFREPKHPLRYRVLAEYLRQIPAAEMGKAFDVCVPLACTYELPMRKVIPERSTAMFLNRD